MTSASALIFIQDSEGARELAKNQPGYRLPFEFWMSGLLAQAQQGVFRDCGSALPFATRFKGLFYVDEESATPPNQNCKNGHDV